MAKKKAFHTQAFRDFRNSVFDLVEILKSIKKAEDIKTLKEAEKEAIRLYIDQMKPALAKVTLQGDQWASETQKDIPN